MKFYYFLLILLFAITALSYNLNNLIMKEQKFSNEKLKKEPNETIKQCENGLENFTECLYGSNKFTSKNIDKICNTFNSEKCQSFFKNPMNSVPACKTIPKEFQNNYKSLFDISKFSMNFFCQKDESNQICPMVKLELSGNKSEKKIMKSVKETCKYTECTETALNLYTTLNKAINYEEDILNEDSEAMENNKIITNILNILQSDECNNINTKYKSKIIKKKNIKKILKNVKIYL